jgi:hypothetical protein
VTELYVSTDIEVDGPIPGPHSMLSFGSAAFDGEKRLVATFSANLETLPDASAHPDTQAWWARHPAAWAKCREDQRPPSEALVEYAAWLDALPGKPVFVGYPAAFDFMFVYWYLIRFAGRSPFSFSALDIKTMAMTLLKSDFRAISKRKLPSRWKDGLPHRHVALDDAIEQGALLCNMLAESRR